MCATGTMAETATTTDMASDDNMTPTAARQLSFPLPSSPSTTLHIHLTSLPYTLLLLLTTTTASTAVPPPLGSFVYAIPSVSAPLSPASNLGVLLTQKAP